MTLHDVEVEYFIPYTIWTEIEAENYDDLNFKVHQEIKTLDERATSIVWSSKEKIS